MGRVGVGALAGLIIIDVVLVALAVQHVRSGDDATAVPPPDNVQTQEPAASAPDEQEPENPDEPEEAEPEEPLGVEAPTDPATSSTTIVNRGEDGAVARAVTGTCGAGGASLEFSSDGGAQFTAAELPEGVDVVVRVSAGSGSDGWVVGTDADCESYAIHRTDDGGQSWAEPESTDGAWHLFAGATADVHAPYVDVAVPCPNEEPVINISMLSESVAFMLCGDGSLIRTRSGGDVWSDPAEREAVPEAITVDFLDESAGLLVAAGRDGCAGLAVLATADSGETWEDRSCIETTGSGHAHLSASGDEAYLARGSDLWFSADGGETWEQRASS